MKFVHSSDLQIGKAFGMFEPDVSNALRDARQDVVRKLGEAARTARATAVLLAGDIFEKQQMSHQTVMRAMENMRSFAQIQWHLMPGNHDRYQENGLWDSIRANSLPANVHLHCHAGAVQIDDGDGAPTFLLPAPLHFISNADDLTAYMDAEATPEGARRIGIAHGSIQGFGEGDSKNYIDPARPERAGLSYLALGDWHRQMKVSDRCWYCGTPEPDQFKLPPDATTTLCNGGFALLVEMSSARALPSVTPIATGHFQWHRVETALTDDSQVNGLESELRSLDPNLSRLVIDLRARGVLSLAGRRSFEIQILENVGAALRALRFDDSSLVLNPTDDDMDEIDHAGFVRVAADRLKAMVADRHDPIKSELASLALKRLYLEHLRLEQTS